MSTGPASPARDLRFWAVLGKLQRSPRLYAAAAWAGIELTAADRQQAERMITDALLDTEVMELNRRLLVAAFPGQLRPAPAGGPTELFYVDCHGERKEPAHLLHNPNWRQSLAVSNGSLTARA